MGLFDLLKQSQSTESNSNGNDTVLIELWSDQAKAWISGGSCTEWQSSAMMERALNSAPHCSRARVKTKSGRVIDSM